jgi:hypothetical protein
VSERKGKKERERERKKESDREKEMKTKHQQVNNATSNNLANGKLASSFTVVSHIAASLNCWWTDFIIDRLSVNWKGR